MKKSLLPLLTSMLCFTISVNAQMGTSPHTLVTTAATTQKTLEPSPLFIASTSKTDETNAANRQGNPSAQFSNDMIIQTDSINQSNVKVATAFNGWIFSAFTLSTGGYGGIEIRKSVDGGFTWTTVMRGLYAGLIYTAVDITVAGLDTANLTIFLAGVVHSGTNPYIAWIDRYHATTGTFIYEDFNESNPIPIYDIAIATDYAHPSIVSSPFSVGVVYSKNGSLDSMIYAASVNGGINYTTRTCVATTSRFYGKVAIAFGLSSNYSNGRYFVAFEDKYLPYYNVGHVLFSHTMNDPTSAFQTPVYVDTTNSSVAGRMGHPRIACSNNFVDNDSGNVSVIIMGDRNFGGNDYDVVAEYSMASVHSTISNWHNLFVASSTSYETGADVAYNDSMKTFDITYYDSLTHQLFAKRHGFNLTPATVWTTLSGQYNDVTTNLIQPFPRVAVNPTSGTAYYVWNSEGINGGIPLFDAENNITGVPVAAPSYNFLSPYPNPATGVVNFNYTLNSNQAVQLSIINLLGQEVISTMDFGTQRAGEYTIPVDFSNLPNGVYVYRFVSGTEIKTGNIVIAH